MEAALTPLPNPRFESEAARRRLQEFYGSAHSTGSAVLAAPSSPPPAPSLITSG